MCTLRQLLWFLVALTLQLRGTSGLTAAHKEGLVHETDQSQCWAFGGKYIIGNNGRYSYNLGHQWLEYLFPALDLAFRTGRAPGVIVWRFNMMSITQEALALSFPRTHIT